MSRDIHANTAAALESESLRPIVMVALHFGSGWARFWSGIGELVWRGDVYHGVGTLGKVGAIEETIEIRSTGAELTLSGLPIDLSAADGRRVSEIALSEHWQGREARIYLATLRANGSFDGEPVQIFGGFMDQMTLAAGSISLTTETDVHDHERTRTRNWTPADQRSSYPDDAGLDAQPSTVEADVKWGAGT